jgi:DNA invertase Pin-like site-specific DNA recombinase
MSKNAIIYARFSSAEQSKGHSLERQKENGQKYVAENGYILSGILTDEGRSAFSGKNRSEGSSLFQFEAEAREGLHTGKVLCVENVDRLSRQGAKAAAQLIWALNENGVDVATWSDNTTYRANSNSDMMELFGLIIKAQLAHEESVKKSERVLDAIGKRYSRIAAGDRTVSIGRAPAWLEKTESGYELNPHRTKVLNEIFDWYVSGVGIYRIVANLNDRNEPGWQDCGEERGNGWYMPYIHRLLQHRAVLGEFITLKGELISPDFFPQAVTADKFMRAQMMRAGKQRTGGRDTTQMRNLLSGMVVCSECQGKAGYQYRVPSTRTYTAKSKEVRVYEIAAAEHLRCDRYRRKHSCSNSIIVDYKLVETSVLDQLLSVAFSEQEEVSQPNQFDIQIAETVRQIEHTTQRLNNLYDQVEDGIKGLGTRIEQRQAELQQLETTLKEQQEARAIDAAKPSHFDDAAMIASLRDDLNSDDPDIRYYARTQTNAALKRVIEEIIICPDGTFTVEADIAVWHFDKNGTCLGGQAL